MKSNSIQVHRENPGNYTVYCKNKPVGTIIRNDKTKYWSIDLENEEYKFNLHRQTSTYALASEALWNYFYANFSED